LPGELNIGLLLYIPYRFLENRVFTALAQAGYDGTRLTELAEAAQVTKQTAGFLVDQLENAGYVERTPDPTDARARLVRITTRGAATIPISQAAIAAIEEEWASHLGEQRMAQLREALARLREITDPYL
jgi:DNA-binding MarR family transcriptional regulator